MPSDLFDHMKQFVHLDEVELARLAALGRMLDDDALARVARAFYDCLMSDPRARTIFTEGEAQIDRLRRTMIVWLRQLFTEPYDHGFLERQASIGRTHVRVRLPQYFMPAAMNLIRDRLSDEIDRLALADGGRTRRAVDKALDMSLAIMLEAFRQDLNRQVRALEQTQYEQQLMESRHLATVGQLAASLAHEIKNPLAGISGALQVIGASLNRAHPHREVIREALSQIDRLDALVRDLLVYSRPKPPQRRPQGVIACIQRALLLLREEPAFRGISIRIEEPAHDVQALLDEAQVQQVIANLLINAAHACQPVARNEGSAIADPSTDVAPARGDGGEICCRVSENDGVVQIEVADTGRGMSADVAASAFEPFYTTKARGTGLGLAICRRIIEAHGGRIELHSTAGLGTRVIIRLPGLGAERTAPARQDHQRAGRQKSHGPAP